MRWYNEARIRIHGAESKGRKYVSLARTMLGALAERNSNGNNTEQSQHHATVDDARISVGFNGWMPFIDIWVDEEEEKEEKEYKFGSEGRADNEIRQRGSPEYTEPFERVRVGGAFYLGEYWAYGRQLLAEFATNVVGTYPEHIPGAGSDTHTWRRFTLQYRFLFTPPFGSNIAAKEQLFTSLHDFASTPLSTPLLLTPRFSTYALRTEENGDKILLVNTSVLMADFNIDLGGVNHPVPALAVYNITADALIGNYVIYPMVGLVNTPRAGKAYGTPQSVVVGDNKFYTAVFSTPGYRTLDEDGGITLTEAAYEITLFYTANDGAGFGRWDLRPFIEDYLDTYVELVPRRPLDTFGWLLGQGLVKAEDSVRLLAIDNDEALLYILALKTDGSVEYTDVTDSIILCTPSGPVLQFQQTERYTVGTHPRALCNYPQSWVYMGEGVVLAKFVDGQGQLNASNLGVGYNVYFAVSTDKGATWTTMAAEGLPGNFLNQFYGNLTVVEPYVDEDSQGIVLVSVLHEGVYRVYASKDLGNTWTSAGKITASETFHKVDSMVWGDQGNNFSRINYYGTRREPALYNPALPYLMAQPEEE